MKPYIKIFLFLVALSVCSCNDFLDRQPLTKWTDDNFWASEQNLRLYANGFYPHFFIGYNTGWTRTAAPLTGPLLSDDIVYNGIQSNFELQVPTARGNNDFISDTGAETAVSWLDQYSGLSWNFAWVRKVNVMLDRIESKMGGILTPSAKDHWLGIGRFFRAMEYSGLVHTFGDVPYFDREVESADLDELYKPRTPRNEVMDAVYDDFKFAMANVTAARSGKTEINRHVVAGMASRWALFEGTWQKYHENNAERAAKFLELAVESAEIVINAGTYNCNATDFRSLFGSNTLEGSPEAILYRRYDAGKNLTHSIASECNFLDSRYPCANLSLVKAFICNDGSDWQTSDNDNNRNFEMSNLLKTRDPRFEATFYKHTTYKGLASCLYIAKFIHRDGLKYLEVAGGSPPVEFTSLNNVTAYPILRYAEVLLNWIEAKAELAELSKGAAVTQADLDLSINAIRNRPLADDAVALGVRKTAPMRLLDMPISLDNGNVPQLIWEIRRERRMEFALEYPSRLTDLKRWKKLEYMDGDENPDILRGTWVKLNEVRNLTDGWEDALSGIIGVVDMDGNETVFDGSDTKMEGFYFRTNIVNRQPYLNLFNVNPYLAPVGRNQRIDYQNRGYNLAQTQGWPQDLN